MQGRWTREQLHWGGIDQLLLHSQPATADACTPASILPDSVLDHWLDTTFSQALLQSQTKPASLTSTAAPDATSLHQQPNALSSPQAAPSTGSTTAIASVSTAALPLHGNSSPVAAAQAEEWFDSFDCGQLRQCGVGSVSVTQDGSAAAAACWGGPPPPQIPAMLRGNLAHAVLGGIAGKSLVKEVMLRSGVDCWHL